MGIGLAVIVVLCVLVAAVIYIFFFSDKNMSGTEFERCARCRNVGLREKMVNFGGNHFCTEEEAADHWADAQW
jgi:hypothetical protein